MHFHSRSCIRKCLRNGGHFVLTLTCQWRFEHRWLVTLCAWYNNSLIPKFQRRWIYTWLSNYIHLKQWDPCKTGAPGFFPGIPTFVTIMTTREIHLTHWGRVTHICVGNVTIIDSVNDLSPWRRQTIIWTSAGILLIGPLGTQWSEILSELHTFSLKKKHLKISSEI